MSSARLATLSNRDEQFRVRSRYLKVVADNWQRRDDVVEKQLASGLAFARCNLDAYAKLRHSDRGNGGFIVVADEVVEIEPISLDIDQHACVKQ